MTLFSLYLHTSNISVLKVHVTRTEHCTRNLKIASCGKDYMKHSVFSLPERGILYDNFVLICYINIQKKITFLNFSMISL